MPLDAAAAQDEATGDSGRDADAAAEFAEMKVGVLLPRRTTIPCRTSLGAVAPLLETRRLAA
jgi:hypothetical protein